MKHTWSVIAAVVISVICFSTAIAGGDKVRGEEGQGSVNQVSFDNQGRQN